MIKLFELYINNLDLKKLKVKIDNILKKYGIEIKYTKHFIKRINNPRNEVDISVDELYDLFKKVYYNHIQDIKMHKDNYNGVIIDKSSFINIPFVLRFNWKTGNIELIFKTIFRKKDFKTSNDKYIVYTEEEKVLNESPDFVNLNGKLLKFYDKESAIFGFLKDKFIYDDSENSEHGFYKDRLEWRYPGRLWKNEKIISFWTYPDSEDFKEIINKIEKESKMNLWNNDWKVEIIKNFEEKEGDYGENFRKRKTELIPIENYELYWDDNIIKKSFSKEEIGKGHVESPLKKQNKINKYFGSMSPKGKQPIEWKQAKLKSESKILKFNNFHHQQ